MKWFNLSLLLTALVLTVMLVVEPFVLARIGPSKAERPPKLPASIIDIRTLSELATPLPAISTLKPRQQVNATKKQASTSYQRSENQPEIAQTQALNQVSFEKQPIDKVVEPSLPDKVDELAHKPAVKVAPVAPAEPPPIITPAICYRFGPLESFSAITEVGDRLVKKFEVTSWGEVEEAYTEQRYWIVLEGVRTNEETKLLVKQLDSKGFAEHYLPLSIEEPQLISLGIFKARDRAERHLATLGSAGFGAVMRDRQVELSRRWLTFKTAADVAKLTKFVTAVDDEAELEECSVGQANEKL